MVSTRIAKTNKTADGFYFFTGNLTIKGITHPTTFDAIIITSDNQVTLTGKIVIDRTKYGIKFRSGNFFKNLGDNLIYNDFDLNIKVTARIA